MTYQDNGYNPRVGYDQQFRQAGAAAAPRWDTLVAGWHLDETTGTRVDVLGNYDMSVVTPVGYDTGKFGNAANYSGSGELHKATSNLGCASDGVVRAMCCWFYAAGPQSDVGCIASTNHATPGGWYLYHESSNYIGVVVNTGQQSYNYRQISTPGWFHLAWFWDAGANLPRLYVDGVGPGTGGSPNPLTANFTTWIRMGNDLLNNQLTGKVDELYLFSAGDADWVADMYNGGTGQVYPL
jgi:hypothetical protein